MACQNKVKPNGIETVMIDDISKLKFDFQYYFRNKPVIFKEAAVNWPAFKKWNPEYLKSVYSDKIFSVAYNKAGFFDTNKGSSNGIVARFNKPMSEIVDLITQENSTYYIQQAVMEEKFPELLADIKQPGLLNSLKKVVVTNLWFGGGGCKSPLHFDIGDNFLVQLVGRKRVTLFPPSATKYLYPAKGQKMPHVSQVNMFKPDDKLFPLFNEANKKKIMLDLEPGDILYIPRKWWHGVETLDTSISVNIWWTGRVLYLLFRIYLKSVSFLHRFSR